MSSWKGVHAFSQPLVVKNAPDQVVVSTPMHFANIMRLKAAGERELVPMRWGFAGKDHANPARAARPWTGFAPSPRRSAPPLLLRHARRLTLKAMGDRLGNG